MIGRLSGLAPRRTTVGTTHSGRLRSVVRNGSSHVLLIVKPYSTRSRRTMVRCIHHLTGLRRRIGSGIFVIPHVCAGGPHAANSNCGNLLRGRSPAKGDGLVRKVTTIHDLRGHIVARANLAATSRVLCPRGLSFISSLIDCRTVNTHSIRSRRRHFITDKVSRPTNVGGPADNGLGILFGSICTTRRGRGFVRGNIRIRSDSGPLTRIILHNNAGSCNRGVPGCRCRSLIGIIGTCRNNSCGGPFVVVSAGRSGSNGGRVRRVHVIGRALFGHS